MIQIRDLSFYYEALRPILREINLTVGQGEIVGLRGENGAGKTTLFNNIVGLLRPCEGDVVVAGVSVLTAPEEARQHLAFVPDESLLYPTLSALENLRMFAMLWNVPPAVAKARGEARLREVGLWDVRNQWVSTYSRGMQQRLAFCTALLHEPTVLLLDEPFSGLDLPSVERMRALLRAFAAGGGSVLVSSHAGDLLSDVSDRLVTLKDGTLTSQPSGLATPGSW